MANIAKASWGIFSKILADMNLEGGFPISVLTDVDGFPIASASEQGMDTEKQAAVVVQIQRAVNQVRSQLGFGQTEEIIFFDTNGQKLIMRMFTANQYEMLLVVMVQGKKKTYRRFTNNAIQGIRKNWILFA